MTVVKGMSLFWVLYGIAGLFGYQNIPSKFKGYSWTKAYIRSQGISWLLLGIPYLIFSFVFPVYFPDLTDRHEISTIFLVALGLPALIFSMIKEIKYKALLKAEQDQSNGYG